MIVKLLVLILIGTVLGFFIAAMALEHFDD